MKKLLVAICVCILSVTAAFAQKGQNAVGVNIGIAPMVEVNGSPTNFGIGAKYQYNVTDPVRLEAAFNYWFGNKNVSVFDIMVNGQYLFNVTDKFTAYPLVGIGYGNVNHINSVSRFAFNVGVGCEYAITSHVSADFEFKYQYMKDFQRLPIQLGISYKF